MTQADTTTTEDMIEQIEALGEKLDQARKVHHRTVHRARPRCRSDADSPAVWRAWITGWPSRFGQDAFG